MSIDPFFINVAQQTLDDLQTRLALTRWPDEIDEGWTFGTDRMELQALVDHPDAHASEAHGADPADAFDVIAQSLPGFGFSEKPKKPGAIFHVGDLWHADDRGARL